METGDETLHFNSLHCKLRNMREGPALATRNKLTSSGKNILHARLVVLTAVNVNVTVVWAATPCLLIQDLKIILG
jgi:hypothetical protein